MKKNSIIFSALSLVIAFGAFAYGATAAETPVAGSLVKTADSSAIYYVGEDGKLYLFPNDKTYFSWFEDFEEVQVVSDETFGAYTLGGNVYYRPGSLLLKTPTSLKVYAVGIGGELRWIESEEMAEEFYGENWNLLVDDVPDSFFTNYFFGEPIDEVTDYDPEAEKEQAPTVGHGRKLKKAEKIKERQQDRLEKRCEYLKESVNRLQKRAERWGMEVPTLGDDYIAACVAGASTEEATEEESSDPADVNEDAKITVCKTPKGNPEATHTIRISRNALKKHLREGYTIGACAGDTEGDTDEEADEDADEEADDETDEEEAVELEISDISVDASSSEATITWTTNVLADSLLEYDDVYPFVSTSSAVSIDDVTSHSIYLNNLEAGTTYYFTLRSEDEAGNIVVSEKQSFTTDEIEADEDESASEEE